MTMNKEFVTYEQAVELKNLLYGEHYGDDYLAWYSSNKDFHYRNMNSPVYPNNQSFIAPFKQQVFAWFREKYNLSVYITDRLHCVDDRELWKCVVNDVYYGVMTFDTYEEAENATIDKLIELVKQQAIP
jgi:hypothetical protein